MMSNQIKRFMQQNALSGPGIGLVVRCFHVVRKSFSQHILEGEDVNVGDSK
jgi:hypothetical protein